MKKKVLILIHKILMIFFLFSLATTTISSFTTFLKNDDLNAFTISLNKTQDTSVEKRIIFEVGGETAKHNLEKTEFKSVYHGSQYYKVVRDNSHVLKVNDIEVTPIESSFLSYNWSLQHNSSYLKQWISFTYVNDSDFSESNGVVVSKTLYTNLDSPETISLIVGNSERLDLKISGVYEDKIGEVMRISNAYKSIYNEPIFFNSEAFAYLSDNLKIDAEINVGVIISKEEYTPSAVQTIFKYQSWEKDLVVNDLFNHVFQNMKDYKQQYNRIHLIVALSSLLALVIVVLLITMKDSLFFKLMSINPFFFILSQFFSILLVFGIGKILKIVSLFYISSVPVVILFAIGFCIVNVCVYSYNKIKEAEAKNE